jgi:hypothetical protein
MAVKRESRKLTKPARSAVNPNLKVEYVGAVQLPFLIQPAVVGVIDMKLGPRALAWGLPGWWMEGVDFEDGRPYGPHRLVPLCGKGAGRARRRYIGHVLRNGTVWRKRLPVLYEAQGEK